MAHKDNKDNSSIIIICHDENKMDTHTDLIEKKLIILFFCVDIVLRKYYNTINIEKKSIYAK